MIQHSKDNKKNLLRFVKRQYDTCLCGIQKQCSRRAFLFNKELLMPLDTSSPVKKSFKIQCLNQWKCQRKITYKHLDKIYLRGRANRILSSNVSQQIASFLLSYTVSIDPLDLPLYNIKLLLLWIKRIYSFKQK